jgi:hypothetical protein
VAGSPSWPRPGSRKLAPIWVPSPPSGCDSAASIGQCLVEDLQRLSAVDKELNPAAQDVADPGRGNSWAGALAHEPDPDAA